MRGHDATLLPAKDRPDDAWTLSWEEGDAALSASFRGLTQDEAVAALDTLQSRAGGGGGFDVPAGGSLELRGEARALCLRLDAGRLCQAAMPAGVAVAIDGTVAASFDAGGTWYVGAATTAVAPTVDPDQPETESGADGTWEGLLVRPEADVDQVDVWFGDTGVGLTRP